MAPERVLMSHYTRRHATNGGRETGSKRAHRLASVMYGRGTKKRMKRKRQQGIRDWRLWGRPVGFTSAGVTEPGEGADKG